MTMSANEWALVSDLTYAMLRLLVHAPPISELTEARLSIVHALEAAEKEHGEPLIQANPSTTTAHRASSAEGELQYIVTREAYYSESALFELRRQNIVDEVQFGCGIGPDSDGQSWGARFTWHSMGSSGGRATPPACRVSAFDDAWAGLRKSGALEILDRHPGAPPTVTVDDVCAALDNLGFQDVTPTERPKGNS